MMFSKPSPILVTSILIFIVSACGMQSQLSTMNDQTKQLAALTTKTATSTDDIDVQTKQANETTQDVDKKVTATSVSTQHLSDTADQGHAEQRQGDSMMDRNDILTSLKADQTIEAKTVHAALYFDAFEFELWTEKLGTPAELEKLKEEAAQEFMSAIQEFTGDMTSTSSQSTDPRMLSLYALAAKLHSSNRLEITATDHPPVTMLTLIEDALKADQEIQEGKLTSEEIPGYEMMILRQKPVAVYLLQVRQNFLSAFPLAKLADIENQGMVSRISMTLLGWTARIASLSIDEIQYQTYVLKLARDTREFLQDIGVDPKTDGKLLRFYRAMHMPSKTSLLRLNTEKELPNSLHDLEQEITQLLQQN